MMPLQDHVRVSQISSIVVSGTNCIIYDRRRLLKYKLPASVAACSVCFHCLSNRRVNFSNHPGYVKQILEDAAYQHPRFNHQASLRQPQRTDGVATASRRQRQAKYVLFLWPIRLRLAAALVRTHRPSGQDSRKRRPRANPQGGLT